MEGEDIGALADALVRSRSALYETNEEQRSDGSTERVRRLRESRSNYFQVVDATAHRVENLLRHARTPEDRQAALNNARYLAGITTREGWENQDGLYHQLAPYIHRTQYIHTLAERIVKALEAGLGSA